MQVGDLVQKNSDVRWIDCDRLFAKEHADMGIIIEVHDEEDIIVVWSCGYRNTYSIYDLELVCK